MKGYKTPVILYDEAEHFLKTGELFEKGQTMPLTEIWTRKSFPVEAVRITSENIGQVAEWCAGTVCRSSSYTPELYIALEKTEYNKIRISRAYVGDWILLTNGIFKNYRNDKFRKSFDPPVQDSDKDDAIFNELCKVLAKSQTEHMKNRNGLSSKTVAEIIRETAEEIMNVYESGSK